MKMQGHRLQYGPASQVRTQDPQQVSVTPAGICTARYVWLLLPELGGAGVFTHTQQITPPHTATIYLLLLGAFLPVFWATGCLHKGLSCICK